MKYLFAMVAGVMASMALPPETNVRQAIALTALVICVLVSISLMIEELKE